MLIGCIIGPDFETAKRQIEKANALCDGVELRLDRLECNSDALIPLVKGEVMLTDTHSRFLHSGKTISTYHNFDETPDDFEAILKSLAHADFYKIACMARSTLDALRMLIFAKKHPNVVGLCMGPLGQITRILAPLVSSPFNFAGNAAPGQLEADELIELYNYRHLSPSTSIYGLIGNPIDHSLGHIFHNRDYREKGLDAVYVKMPLEENELPQFFALAKELGIKGLSVTRPFKEKVFDVIDVLDEDAKAIGAVNTLTFEGGKICGQNTDAPGALDAIESHLTVAGKTCVILGAGGSSKAIQYEAKKRGASVFVLSRRFGNLDKLPPYDILINTTPVEVPIDLAQLQPNKVVMDITVRHKNSPLIQRAKELGCSLIFGQEMWDHQALGQIKRWFKNRTPASASTLA